MELQYETIKIKSTTLNVIKHYKQTGETYDDAIIHMANLKAMSPSVSAIAPGCTPISLKDETIELLNKKRKQTETFDDTIKRLSSGIIGEPLYG
jgi:hypothetical protein